MKKHNRLKWVILILILALGLYGASSISTTNLKPYPLPFANQYPREQLNKIMLAELALHRQQPEQASQIYLDLAQATQESQFAERAVFIIMETGDLQLIKPAVILWAKLAPDNLEAQQLAASVVLRLGEYELAETYLERILLNSKTLEEIQRLSANFNAENKLPAPINASLQALHKQYADNPKMLLGLAVIYSDHQQLQPALALLDHLLALSPDAIQAIELKVNILLSLEGAESAVGFLKKVAAQTHNAHDPYLQLLMAEVYFRQQDYPTANKLLLPLQTETEVNAKAYILLAQIALYQQHAAQARDYLLKAEQLPLSANIARILLASIAEYDNDYLTAIDWYLKIEEGPYLLSARLNTALLLTKLGNPAAALDLLQQVEASSYQDIKQLILLEVDILTFDNQWQKAFSVLSNALQTLPNDTQLLYLRALIAHQLGRDDVTEQDLKKVLKIDPHQVDALNALGFVLTEQGHYQAAMGYLKRAIALDPNNPAILDSMGWLRYRLGQVGESLKLLRRAYDLDPNNEHAAHLGEVLWHNGQHQLAEDIWQKALQASPNNQDLQAIIKRVKNTP